MNQKRTIKAKEILNDIRSGMTPAQLINKYRFSTKSLRLIFRKLLEANIISKSELDDIRPLYHCSIDIRLRRLPRRRLIFPVKIYEEGNPFKAGIVRDISERGVCIQGIEAAMGDVKNFIIRTGFFGEMSTLVFEAKCKWSRVENNSRREIVAGFEITNISSLDSKELKKFLPQK